MDNTNSKIITFCFLIAGIIVGVVVSVFLDTAAAIATGSFGRAVSLDLIRHGLPVLAGLGVAVGLRINGKVAAWADEVVTELRRVVWPSRKDTVGMTVVVCIMLLISGVVLGMFDVLSSNVVDWLLRQNFLGIFS